MDPIHCLIEDLGLMDSFTCGMVGIRFGNRLDCFVEIILSLFFSSGSSENNACGGAIILL